MNVVLLISGRVTYIPERTLPRKDKEVPTERGMRELENSEFCGPKERPRVSSVYGREEFNKRVQKG